MCPMLHEDTEFKGAGGAPPETHCEALRLRK